MKKNLFHMAVTNCHKARCCGEDLLRFDDPTGKNPDISIYIRKQKTQELVCTIEICRTDKVDSDKTKTINLMKKTPSVVEGYILDFEKFLLYKIDRNSNGEPSSRKITTNEISLFSLKIDPIIKEVKDELNIS